MKLYGIELPEPKPTNTSQAIQVARKIHQDYINRRTRNTKMQRWDKYWAKVYDIVLDQLRSNSAKKFGRQDRTVIIERR